MPASLADYVSAISNVLAQTGAIYWVAMGIVVGLAAMVVRRIRK